MEILLGKEKVFNPILDAVSVPLTSSFMWMITVRMFSARAPSARAVGEKWLSAENEGRDQELPPLYKGSCLTALIGRKLIP